MTRRFQIAVFFSGAVILSVMILNLVTPGVPWCIFPIFGILWWPLSVYFAGRKQPLLFAAYGTGLLWALFLLTYLFTSPGAHPWFLYPMLGTFWWPLSVWGSIVGARKFSVTATLHIILTLLTINLITSPGAWWWIYPSIFVIWWPLSMHLHFLNRKEKEGEEE
jgi:hypothetical protein